MVIACVTVPESKLRPCASSGNRVCEGWPDIKHVNEDIIKIDLPIKDLIPIVTVICRIGIKSL